ncbi:hypothetical protein MMC16_000039 [Acarospora aff. strigata]|nr:hypothetical protein [Acarospora aff. strigata]
MVWKDPLSTSVFYTFIASLRKRIREDVKETSSTHKFIRTLRESGKLVRNYSQNIDGLETRLGLCTDIHRGKGNRSRFVKRVTNKPRPLLPVLPGSELDGGCEVVQLHGNLKDLRCTLCQKLCKWDEEHEETFLGGQAPQCNACVINDEHRRGRGKRGTAVGTLRPNVILYGEEHPAEDALAQITTHDIALAPDVLLILGTSLRVHGLKILVKEFAKAVHARKAGKGKVIFINRTKPCESAWNEIIDWWVGMDCDDWVHDLHGRRSDLWERQGMLQLSVVKLAMKPCTEDYQEKALDMEVLEMNKENILLNNQHNPFEESLIVDNNKHQPGAVKAIRPRAEAKIIEVASRQGRITTKPPLSELSTETMSSLEPRIGATSTITGPKTPSKTSVARLASNQLPTPPPSRQVSTGKRKASDRALQVSAYTDDLLASPSKRKKDNVDIWEDIMEKGSDLDGRIIRDRISQEAVWVSFTRRMEKVEIPTSAAMSSPCKGRRKKTAAA